MCIWMGLNLFSEIVWFLFHVWNYQYHLYFRVNEFVTHSLAITVYTELHKTSLVQLQQLTRSNHPFTPCNHNNGWTFLFVCLEDTFRLQERLQVHDTREIFPKIVCQMCLVILAFINWVSSLKVRLLPALSIIVYAFIFVSVS